MGLESARNPPKRKMAPLVISRLSRDQNKTGAKAGLEPVKENDYDWQVMNHGYPLCLTAEVPERKKNKIFLWYRVLLDTGTLRAPGWKDSSESSTRIIKQTSLKVKVAFIMPEDL